MMCYMRRGLSASGVLFTVVLLVLTGVWATGQPAPGISGFEDTEFGFAYIPDQTFEVVARIDIEQTGGEDRDFFIVIDGGQSQDVSNRAAVNPDDETDRVEYQLINPDNGEVVSDFSAGIPSPSQVLSGTIPGATTGPWRRYKSVDVILRVEEGQLENPDPDYQDELEMRIYYGSVDDPDSYNETAPEESATLTVRGNVDPFVEVALVEPGAGFPPGRPGPVRETERDMDFGVLEEGATRSYDLLVNSNTLFSIAAESDHLGVLEYQGDDAEDGELPTHVPYEFRIGGTPVDLSGGEALFGSGLIGFRWNLEVRIKEFGVPVAGEYRDRIEITVFADE